MKKIVLFIPTIAMIISVSAQFHFARPQKFNHAKDPKPLIGFDCIRASNVSILEQMPLDSSGSSMLDLKKFITVPQGTGSNTYVEVADYTYNQSSGNWNVNYIDQYELYFDILKKVVANYNIKSQRTNQSLNINLYGEFTFNQTNKADTETVYRINGLDSSFYMRNTFFYDSNSMLKSIYNYFYSSSSQLNTYTYDSMGNTTEELIMLAKSQFALLDSLQRNRYIYDSLGRIVESISEEYHLNGSPYEWTVMERITYTYDNYGILIENKIYRYDPVFNHQAVLESVHQYEYNQYGKITSFTELKNQNNIYFSRTKLLIEYDNNNEATVGNSYIWNGTEYEDEVYRHYEFSNTNTSVKTPGKNRLAIRLYPCPSRDMLFIQSENKPIELKIMDSNGRCLQHLKNEEGIDQVDISLLAAGAYLLYIDHYIEKFIKEG